MTQPAYALVPSSTESISKHFWDETRQSFNKIKLTQWANFHHLATVAYRAMLRSFVHYKEGGQRLAQIPPLK